MAKKKENQASVEKASAKAAEKVKVEKTRREFKQLTLANPNYFGNLPEIGVEPVELMASNTSYEQLTCLGYHPQTEMLEAVVAIKRTAGYGGDVCQSGSPEYVRFFTSTDGGATWQDEGMSSFTAYDIPGPKPLEYALSLKIDPKRTFCSSENLIQARAILSWNQPIPAHTPNFKPAYGSVLEADIQVDPLLFIIFDDLLEHAHLSLPDNLQGLVDPAQQIELTKKQPLLPLKLAQVYKEKGVPAHRYLFSQIQKIGGEIQPFSLLGGAFEATLLDLDLDILDILGALAKTDGDTRYEELECVGLNPNTKRLEAALTVKLSSGYSGDLCSPGSQEYVAFWVDWDDGAGWTYAGTGAVNVHDIDHLPADGLQYAVSVPVNLDAHRQPCEAGPKVVRVRAILSWQTPPPAGNPDFIPTWGNREEARVHLYPGPVVGSDDHDPYMFTVGNMAVCDISQSDGMATGSGVLAAFDASESPFGGKVAITGLILNPPNVMGGAEPFKYKIQVRELPSTAWQTLDDRFQITIVEQNGVGLPVMYHDWQEVDADGFYTYREQMYPNQWREVAANMLARWDTGSRSGLWEIRMLAKLPDGTLIPGAEITCAVDGSTRSTVLVHLDNESPDVALAITGVSHGGGPVEPASDCGDFEIGDTIHGTYAASDAHFRSLSLSVAPGGPANGAAPSPSSRVYPLTASTNGASGNWTLDTSAMQACGYILRLRASDRTIVNSGSLGWHSGASVGFCLREPQVEGPQDG